jgi:DNA-binding SARP family transcriptional activator
VSSPRPIVLEPARAPRYLRLTSALDFRVLGPLQVAANGTSLPLGGAKQRAVLALLLLHAGEVVSADRLVDALWGEAPPSSAANMLQGYVSQLRKALEPGRGRGEHVLLVSQPPGYALRVAPEQVDASRFLRLADEARRLLEQGNAAASADRFRAALALWRGDALADLEYEPFARPHVERLEELRLRAVEDLNDAELARGAHRALVPELRRLVTDHPLRERLRGQLMLALYRAGRQAEALEAYRDARRDLRDGLAIEPGPALRELERAILHQDPALGVPAAAPRLPARRPRRALALVAVALVAAGATGFAALTHGHRGRVAVRPNSVAVVDPARGGVVADLRVGAYPGPLAGDRDFVYVANIGEATVDRIDPVARRVFDTASLSRATDLVAARGHLWAANAGAPGHTLAPPGTVLDVELGSAATRTFRVGPTVDGPEEETTLAGRADGASIWAGNQSSRTVVRLEPKGPTAHAIAPGGLAVVGKPGAADVVWATDPGRDLVVRIDGATGRVLERIPIPGRPMRIAADARAVWVVTRGTESKRIWEPTHGTTPALWKISESTDQPVERIPLPLTPLRVALGGGSVWVTAMRVLSPRGFSTDATLFRIDPSTSRIVARIPLRTRAVDGVLFSHRLVWAAIPPSQ